MKIYNSKIELIIDRPAVPVEDIVYGKAPLPKSPKPAALLDHRGTSNTLKKHLITTHLK